MDEATSAALRDTIPDTTRIIGEFPFDPVLIKAGLMGQAVPSDYPAAAAVLERLAARVEGTCPAG